MHTTTELTTTMPLVLEEDTEFHALEELYVRIHIAKDGWRGERAYDAYIFADEAYRYAQRGNPVGMVRSLEAAVEIEDRWSGHHPRERVWDDVLAYARTLTVVTVSE